jgi:hypothetical protein
LLSPAALGKGVIWENGVWEVAALRHVAMMPIISSRRVAIRKAAMSMGTSVLGAWFSHLHNSIVMLTAYYGVEVRSADLDRSFSGSRSLRRSNPRLRRIAA